MDVRTHKALASAEQKTALRLTFSRQRFDLTDLVALLGAVDELYETLYSVAITDPQGVEIILKPSVTPPTEGADAKSGTDPVSRPATGEGRAKGLRHFEETHQHLLERVPPVTGRELQEWFSAIEAGPAFLRFDDKVNWLRDEYGLAQGHATAIVHEHDKARAEAAFAPSTPTAALPKPRIEVQSLSKRSPLVLELHGSGVMASAALLLLYEIVKHPAKIGGLFHGVRAGHHEARRRAAIAKLQADEIQRLGYDITAEIIPPPTRAESMSVEP
jgi:hypothetical protein